MKQEASLASFDWTSQERHQRRLNQAIHGLGLLNVSTELRECVNVVTSGFEHVNKHEMASHAQWALSIIYQHECKALIMCKG